MMCFNSDFRYRFRKRQDCLTKIPKSTQTKGSFKVAVLKLLKSTQC